jgi:tetratricopeptide (TPR) repeat protein
VHQYFAKSKKVLDLFLNINIKQIINMKHHSSKLFLVVLVGAFLASCSSVDMNKLAQQQKLTVTPNPLELLGDSVRFDISVIMPVKMLKKNKFYTVKTAFKAFDNRLELGNVVFNGNDFPQASTVPPTMSRSFVFPYSDNLKKGDVLITGEYSDLNKKVKKGPELSIAKGIITTPLLVSNVYPVVFVDHGYDNREQLQPTTVDFFFQKRIAKLDDKEKNGSRGKFFEKFIAKKFVTRTVNIIGTHSPEGFEAYNEKLSGDRAMTIEKYYREAMKKFNYGIVADSITFVVKGKIKDWSDFKILLDSAKKLKPEQKSEILAIVDGTDGTFHQKEIQLQKLKSYKILVSEIYPKLRNAKTEVLTVKTRLTDAQIFVIAKKIIDGTATPSDTLSDTQLLYAATLTPTIEEQEAILTAATKKNDSYASHLNLGALILTKAKKEPNPANVSKLVENALVQFNLARTKAESAEVYLNLSSANLLKGDKITAMNYLTKAMQFPANTEVNKGIKAMQGVLDIKAGKYESATQNFMNAGTDPKITYNRALSLLLKKEYSSAKSTFDESILVDANFALSYYGAAIAASKMNDVNVASEYLKKAFKLDDSLKAKALDDLEFVSVKDNQTFKDSFK